MGFKEMTSFLFLFLSLQAFAGGGWVSSGGEIFKNAKNPWFVKNTKDVAYCIQFSKSEFTIDQASAETLVEQSLTYWKEQLDNNSMIKINQPGALTAPMIDVATQNFSKNTTCNGTENLIFKFGYNNLDADELKFLGTPEKFIGITIRKDYDEVLLKGSGVIYISGDIGAHAYSKTTSEVIDTAWKYPKLLQYVLIHELGHMMGIPHTGSGIMSEVFLDQLLIRKFAALYLREPIAPFIKPQTQVSICPDMLIGKGSQKFIYTYFTLPNASDCIRLELIKNTNEFRILTKLTTEDETAWTKIGSLFIDQNEIVDFSLKPAVLLQIDSKQTVFPNLSSSFLIGPVFQNYKVDGHITFAKSLKPYPVQVDLSSDSFVIYGTHQNQLRQIFSYGNSILYSLLNPF